MRHGYSINRNGTSKTVQNVFITINNAVRYSCMSCDYLRHQNAYQLIARSMPQQHMPRRKNRFDNWRKCR